MRLYVFDDIARINSIVKKGDEAVTICAAAARGWRRERCVCVRVCRVPGSTRVMPPTVCVRHVRRAPR